MSPLLSSRHRAPECAITWWALAVITAPLPGVTVIVVVHAARQVTGMVYGPGPGCAGSGREPAKAVATAARAQRIRLTAVSGCSP